jgi:hypothetical protein
MAATDVMGSKQLEVKDNIFIAASISEHQQKETERTEQNTANARSHVEVHQEVYQREAKAMPRGKPNFLSIEHEADSTYSC